MWVTEVWQTVSLTMKEKDVGRRKRRIKKCWYRGDRRNLIRAGKISEEKRWRLTRTWQATRILASFPPLTLRSTTGLFLPIGPLIKFRLPKSDFCCQGQNLTHRLLIGRGYDRPRQSPLLFARTGASPFPCPCSHALVVQSTWELDLVRLWSTITSCPPLIG